ncbi:hypothetical protein [Ideonella sp.]|uniref:hypothetical protein n=1 Tax=Ideonella sp. TaxID=1929293 RepID=UPI003BB643BC
MTSPIRRPARLTSDLLHRQGLALALACASLLASPLALAKDAPVPVAVDAGFNAAEVAAKRFLIADNKALKGITRVAVPVFVVDFVTADNVSTQTSGFGGFGRASSSLYYKLLGVGEPEFQALTDAMYADFMQRLKDSGLQVLSPQEFQAAAAYRKLAASGKKTPIKSDTNTILSPQGLPVYGFARASTGPAKPSAGVFGALAGIGDGFSAVGDALDSIELAQQLNAATLEVRLRVNFVELADHNKGFFGRIANTASTSGKTFPSIDGVMVQVQQGPMRSSMSLDSTLVLDPAVFAEVREKATTAGDVAGAVLVGLIRMASKSSDSSSSSEMEAVADPVRYQQIIGAGMNSLSDVVVARLKTER